MPAINIQWLLLLVSLWCLARRAVASVVIDHRFSPSSGCGKAFPAGATPGGPSLNQSIVSRGVNRTYLLHLPPSYKTRKPAALYLSFPGATKNASEQEGLSQFSNPMFNPDGIAVYPQGINFYLLSNPSVDSAHPNDLDFAWDLLNHLESTLCIDRRRVYAAGKSNGGGFTNLLACNSTLSPRFAAFAAVSGAYYNDTSVANIGPCRPGLKHTPFLEFHGLNDTVVPYDGKVRATVNATEPPVPVFLDGWAQRNGCPAGTPAQRNESLYAGLVLHESWTCAGRDGVLQHYRENDLGHIWPSTVFNDDCADHPEQCPMGHYVYNGTKVIFDFFSRYALPESRH